MKNRVVHIDILGQRYAVRSDLDPQYVAELAGYLDEKMRLAARELASADPLRVAVIAAINLCDELYRTRAESGGATARLHDRAAAIERMVDAVLGTTALPAIRAANE